MINDTRYFASGTGAAGLVGAFLWWIMRGLGVRTGVGLSSVRPASCFLFPLTCVTCLGPALYNSVDVFLPSTERHRISRFLSTFDI